MDNQDGRNSPDKGWSLSVSDVTHPLYQARRWMFLLAVIFMASGAIGFPILLVAAFMRSENCVYLPFGILPAISIWLGVMLYSAARAAIESHTRNNGRALFIALVRLRTWFQIIGWLAIVSLLSQIAYVLLWIGRTFLW